MRFFVYRFAFVCILNAVEGLSGDRAMSQVLGLRADEGKSMAKGSAEGNGWGEFLRLRLFTVIFLTGSFWDMRQDAR